MTRGLGDSMALRLACHDEKVHATMAPQGSDARAIFDAVEQARVESIGTLRMEGVACEPAFDDGGEVLQGEFHRHRAARGCADRRGRRHDGA
ncbi:hypothetical protein [Rhizobium yanglingense]